MSDSATGARARAHAVGLAACSAAWLFAGPLCLSERPWLALILAAGGIALQYIAGTDEPGTEGAGRWTRAVALVAAAIGAMAAARLPAAFGVPLWLAMAAGLAGSITRSPDSALAHAGRRLAPAATILLAQALLVLSLVRPFMQNGHVPMVGPASAGLLRVLGWDTGADLGALHVRDGGEAYRFVATAEKLALTFFLSYGAALWLSRWAAPARPAVRLSTWMLLAPAYAVARFSLVAAFAAGKYGSLQSFLQPVPVLVSLVPFVWLSSRLVVPPPEGAPIAARRLGARLAALTACTAVLATCWAASGFDPGRAKAGRVLVDESHGDWESTSVPFDREYFGMHSGYSYTELLRGLGYYYDVRVHERGELTARILQDVDVLLLKTPFLAYTPAEQSAVQDFTAAGGGVLLIGDHTNFLGMNARLNQIATPMGISYRSDHNMLLWSGEYRGEFTHQPPQHPWLGHPAFVLVDSIVALDGCGFWLEGWEAESVMWRPDLVSELADYSDISFFGSSDVNGATVQGPQCLAAASRYGAGRVVALGDSTIFSNFTMHDAGRWELLLGCTEYLNRRNLLPGGHWAFAGVLALAAWIALYTAGAARLARPRSGLLLVASAGLASVPFLVGAWKAHCYAFPQSLRDLPLAHVVGKFETDGSLRPSSASFQNVFNALARFGLVPREAALEGAGDWSGTELLVLLEPGRAIGAEAMLGIERYVQGGGRLLILDSALNTRSTAVGLVQLFGMDYRDGHATTAVRTVELGTPFSSDAAPLVLLDAIEFWSNDEKNYRPSAASSLLATHVRGIVGGDPLLQVGDLTVAARADVGQGRVVVATVGFALSDGVLGDPFRGQTPDETVRAQYELLFDLLDALVAPETESKKGG